LACACGELRGGILRCDSGRIGVRLTARVQLVRHARVQRDT
jgi:hypothetical protein